MFSGFLFVKGVAEGFGSFLMVSRRALKNYIVLVYSVISYEAD